MDPNVCGDVNGEFACTENAGHLTGHVARQDGKVKALWSYGTAGTPSPVIGPKRVCNVCGRAHKF